MKFCKMSKLSYEWKITKYFFWELLLNAFNMFYTVRIFSRRLAGYLYTPDQPILWDAGFELVPEFDDARLVSELIVLVLHLILALVCIRAYKHDDYYAMNILRRYLLLITVGQFIRAFTFLPTSLPAPAVHCQSSSDDYIEIDSISSIFWDGGSMDSVFFNCGDLIFSGHIFHTTTIILLIEHYWYKMTERRWGIVLYPMILAHSWIILSSRQHYSVDLVVGIYVGIMLWYSTINRIKDYNPRAGEIILF